MAFLSTSAGWVAPQESSAWIAPSEMAGWVSPSEVSGWVSPSEVAGWVGYNAQPNPGHYAMGNPGHYAMGNPGHYESGQSTPEVMMPVPPPGSESQEEANDVDVVGILGQTVSPALDAIKFWTGGAEIEQAKAEAMLADAKAKAELAKAQALMGLKTKPQGIDTKTLLLLGGGALALFLILR